MAFQTFAGARRFANPEIHISPTTYTLADAEPYPARNRKVDQTLKFLQFQTIQDGRLTHYLHDPESDGPDADPLDLELDTGAPVPRQTPYQIDGDEPFEFQLQELAGRFDMRNFSRNVMSQDIDQVEFQVAAKVRAIRATFGNLFINGDASSSGHFDGLKKWTDPTVLGQLITPGAGSFSLLTIFDNLDEAIFKLESNDRDLGNLLIVCHSQTLKAMMQLARQISGTAMLDSRFSPDLGYVAPHYMGIPICLNDHIEVTKVIPSGDYSDLYVLDRKSVVGLVHEGRPDIQLESVQSGTSSAKSHIVSWYVGLASFTDLGLVRIEKQEVVSGA